MDGIKFLETVREQLIREVRRAHYRGYDPYDGLLSPFARLPIFRKSPFLRMIWQQGVKRLPTQARPFLGIPPQENPKALALFLEGWMDWENAPDREKEIRALYGRILQKFRKGPLAGWGYPFPWQSRLFFLPANAPNSVVTSFVLLALSRVELDEKALRAAQSLWELRRENPYGLFVPYAPESRTFVPNVTALVAWAFTQMAQKLEKKALWLDRALKLMRTVVRFQQPDGSWPYANHPGMKWVDNFHTGYILVSLKAVTEATQEPFLTEALYRGYEFWEQRFFDEQGHVLGGSLGKLRPPDIHDYTQAIETLLIFPEKTEQAFRVAVEMVETLWNPKGGCFWKSTRHRGCYIRWGQAWAFKSLSHLLRLVRK